MCAWHRTGAAKRHDLFDLREREAEAAPVRDEFEDAECFRRIHAVPRRGPLRRRENTAILVEAKRFGRDAAPMRDIADEQPAWPHEPRINLAAWGRVKRWRRRIGSRLIAGRETRMWHQDGVRDLGQRRYEPSKKSRGRCCANELRGDEDWRGTGRIPENVSVAEHASMTAGFANDADAGRTPRRLRTAPRAARKQPAGALSRTSRPCPAGPCRWRPSPSARRRHIGRRHVTLDVTSTSPYARE